MGDPAVTREVVGQMGVVREIKERQVVADRPEIVALGVIDAGTFAIHEQPRRLRDQASEADQGQAQQNQTGEESAQSQPHRCRELHSFPGVVPKVRDSTRCVGGRWGGERARPVWIP